MRKIENLNKEIEVFFFLRPSRNYRIEKYNNRHEHTLNELETGAGEPGARPTTLTPSEQQGRQSEENGQSFRVCGTVTKTLHVCYQSPLREE